MGYRRSRARARPAAADRRTAGAACWSPARRGRRARGSRPRASAPPPSAASSARDRTQRCPRSSCAGRARSSGRRCSRRACTAGARRRRGRRGRSGRTSRPRSRRSSAGSSSCRSRTGRAARRTSPRGISSEMPSTARVSPNSLTTSSSRTSAGIALIAHRASSAAPSLPGAPVVELLPELEVEERLGRHDLGERPDAVRHVEQPAAVGADHLDQEVEAAGGDDDVVGLLPVRELVRDDLRRTGRPDADHRRRVEAEAERVRDPGDLEDALVAEPPVACADGRLGDAEVGGDPAERLAAVPLERLDDPPVDPVELGRAKDGPAPCLTPATRLPAGLPLSTPWPPIGCAMRGFPTKPVRIRQTDTRGRRDATGLRRASRRHA